MSKMRGIKPEFWSSEQIVNCTPLARLLFIGMWNFCDDAGIHPASAKRLKMEVFPADDFNIEQINQWVTELIDNKLLFQYNADDGDYWIVTGWHHQKINRPYFKHPKPNTLPKQCSSTAQTLLKHCSNMTETKRNETKRNEYEMNMKRNEHEIKNDLCLNKSDFEKIITYALENGFEHLAPRNNAIIHTSINSECIFVDWKIAIDSIQDKQKITSWQYLAKIAMQIAADRKAGLPPPSSKTQNAEPEISQSERNQRIFDNLTKKSKIIELTEKEKMMLADAKSELEKEKVV